MDRNDAAGVADYAKKLFPVTSQERLDSLGVMMLDFPNPLFAQQILLQHSQESEVLSIPKVRAMLEAEEGRRHETAEQRRQAARDAIEAKKREFVARVEERSRSRQEAEEMLNNLDADDLRMLHEDVARTFPFLAKGDREKDAGLRRVMHYRLMTGNRQQHRAPEPQRHPAAMVAADFDDAA